MPWAHDVTSVSPLRLCLFGAAPDTGNLGVSALCYSVVGGLARCDPRTELTVFDEGRGVRPATLEFATGPFRFAFCGATQTRRVWQRRSFWNLRVCNWLGGLGNPAVARLRAADAVLDISGGDSFTDLYGPRRFHSVTFSKRLALEHHRPLVLLPQTYGPYRDRRCRALAADIVRRAAMAWARDARSFEVLKDLLGPDFDPVRHRCGVDVAFALESRPPRAPLPEPLATWLGARSVGPPWPTSTRSGRALHRPWEGEAPAEPNTPPADTFPPSHLPTFPRPVIGFNVSGLIWHDPDGARTRYGFQADYRQCVLGFLRRVLRETDARIVLVPHVLTSPGHYESDPAANAAVAAALADEPGAAERVAAVPPVYDPMEMKWLIARLDWFCGTRMHATIAGLSSGVPTAAIAYSVKTAGVFETCGQGGCVADPRVAGTADVVDRLWTAWQDRAAARTALAGPARGNRARAAQQMVAILAHVRPGVAAALGREVPA